MFNLRELSTWDFKNRFFLKTSGDKLVHISSLYGSIVKSIMFGRDFIEYSAETREPLNLYEVVFTGESLKTIVRELPGFRIMAEFEGVPSNLTSSFRVVDKIASEVCSYRHYWSTNLCRVPKRACDYYMVDVLARGSIMFSLYRRVKELYLELSREYVGFVVGLLVSGLSSIDFKLSKSEGEHCVLAERAKLVSWRGVKLWLSRGDRLVCIEVEKRLGAVNPDVVVNLDGKVFLFECKTGPPKTWISKAIKQARLYREYGGAVLVTPRSLAKEELEALQQYYEVVVKCSPDSAFECSKAIVELISSTG